MFKLDEPRFSGAHDPLAALVLCGAHRADRVMIAGEWRVVDGQPVGLDLAALIAEHQRGGAGFRLIGPTRAIPRSIISAPPSPMFSFRPPRE